MHPYSTDFGERDRVLPFLILPSLLFAWLAWRFEQSVNIPYFWIVGAPSVLGFYGMLYKGFDLWGWQVAILHRTKLVCVPNLNGHWVGHVRSSHESKWNEYPGTLTIEQTWTKIRVRFKGERSDSISTMAAVLTSGQDAPLLIYGYRNEPRDDAVSTMQMHHGTARLNWTENNGSWTLQGGYYTGRGRTTHGTMRFSRDAN